MPVGIVGRQVKSAYARSSSWGVAASVTQQILLLDTDGFDSQVERVDDEAFTQDFIGVGEAGDHRPLTPRWKMDLRFEQAAPTLIAASMGSAAAPSVVSSAGAASLVAYSHVITMAPALSHFFTLANAFSTMYVQEVQTSRIGGFVLSVGNQGRWRIEFKTVGNKTVYNSTTNTASTVNGAAAASLSNRAFRKNTRFRLNMQSAGALGPTDESNIVREFTLDTDRPLAQDHVCNSDSIIEADDDGFFVGELTVMFARMTSASANSLARGLASMVTLKGDAFMVGDYINSTTQRSLLIEWPALQMQADGFKAVTTGHGQVRPEVKFSLQAASAAPTGMSGLTAPMRVTIVNGGSANLLA